MPRISHKSGEEIVVAAVQDGFFTANYERIYRLDATVSSFNLSLPTASGFAGSDIILYAEHDSANGIDVYPDGSETVAGLATITINKRETVLLTSNGVDDWMKIGP